MINSQKGGYSVVVWKRELFWRMKMRWGSKNWQGSRKVSQGRCGTGKLICRERMLLFKMVPAYFLPLLLADCRQNCIYKATPHLLRQNFLKRLNRCPPFSRRLAGRAVVGSGGSFHRRFAGRGSSSSSALVL